MDTCGNGPPLLARVQEKLEGTPPLTVYSVRDTGALGADHNSIFRVVLTGPPQHSARLALAWPSRLRC